jgi:AraC-like DNA-binding protein
VKFHTFTPTEQLRPFIRKYIIIESSDARVNRVLPDTGFAVAFRLKGNVNYINNDSVNLLPSRVITGLRKSFRLINYEQQASTLIVLFKETGANAFFRIPLQELFGESLSLDQIIPQQQLHLVEEQLAEVSDNKSKINTVENFLLSILIDIKPDKLITNAVQEIQSAHGIIRIKELASSLHISHDAFEKRFRRIIGTSPKQFSSIVRMKEVINKIRQHQPLGDIAFEAGYFDQAHFNREFKSFAGLSPKEYFRSTLLW